MRFLTACSVRILSLAVLILMAAGAQAALTVTSQTPGNITTTRSPLNFTVVEAGDAVQYTLTDYYGQPVTTQTVSAAEGTATIPLPTLPPGFYTLTCASGTQQATASLGVLLDRGNAPLPREGRICTDAALTFLTTKANIPKIAHLVRVAGIPWVRERLIWRDIEPTPGARQWTASPSPYQTTMDAYANEGIHVENMWHDAPDWSHPGMQGGTYSPDDLRTVYAFARDAAKQYANVVQAWEMWNEPEGPGFFADLSDRFVGYEKATYLGLKAGNPGVQAFPAALVGPSNFGQHMYETMAGYSDGCTWHAYGQTSGLISALGQTYQPMFRGAPALAGKPIRLTECGVHANVPDQGTRLLDADGERQQCRFIPRMAACALAAGNEKVFYFVLPDYMEGSVQYGLLRGDLTPNPSFVALSAAANLIGVSRYLGEDRSHPGVSIYAFATPHGTVLVAWADTATTLTLPTEQQQIRMANIFGAQQVCTAHGGLVTVSVGPEASYLVGMGHAITKQLVKPVPVKVAPPATAAPIILVGHDDRTLPVNRAQDAYLLERVDAANRCIPFTYVADVYNFGAQTARGTVRLDLPGGWRAEPSRTTVTLPSMGRVTCTFTVTPCAAPQSVNRLAVLGTFGKTQVAPSASYVVVDPRLTLLQAATRQALNWTDATRWQPNNAAIAPTTVTNVDAQTLQFQSTFTAEGDRWVYPTLPLTTPLPKDSYALTFDYQCNVDSPASCLRMMCVKQNGTTYINGAGLPITTKRQHGIIFLRDLALLHRVPDDHDGVFDVNTVKAVCFGGNFAAKGLDQATITVSNFALYRSSAVPIVAEAELSTQHSAGWGPVSGDGYSGGRYLNLWESAAPGPEGHWVDIPFTVPTTGRYTVYFAGNSLSRLSPPCSISPFSWRIDAGTAQLVNAPKPQRTPPGIRELEETPAVLGTVSLNAGPHVFHLSINTRREAFDTNYAIWFDAVILQPGE